MVFILKLNQFFIYSLNSIAWMKYVQFLHTFFSWLGDYLAIVSDISFKSSSNIWLTLELKSCINTHIFDDF
jgi:hypothetical protein